MHLLMTVSVLEDFVATLPGPPGAHGLDTP